MKAAERKPWLELKLMIAHYVDDDETGEPVIEGGETWRATLCHLCKYAKFYGDDDGECSHPLEVVNRDMFDVWAGIMDCWGFRPTMKLARAQELAAMPEPWNGYD